jgi:ribonucleoside-diphosphate reductase alpha chain
MPTHELVVSRDNIRVFSERISLKNTNKVARLKKILSSYTRNEYKEKFIAYVTSVNHAGIDDVYDTTVEEVNSFDANGIIVHNCGESPMRGVGESCNLGSINLTKFIKDKDIDWDRLAESTKLAIRFLDNMIDASAYPSKIVEQSVKETRKIGLGIMGFADLLIMFDIKYSSRQAIDMAGKVMSFISDVANQYSVEIGKEKGAYLAYKEGCKNRRNSINMVIAPTGTLSLLSGCSSGIEPNFSKEYTRILNNEMVKIVHPLKDSPSFEMTYDVPVEQHLNIQAEFQKYTDGAISKTINAPENITVREIKELILKAHKLGIKGFTLFRQNCSREALIKGCTECQI